MLRSLFLVVFLLLPADGLSQNAKVIPVAVNHVGQDQVGTYIAFALKEAIRASRSFRLVDHDPAPSTARIVVQLVSVESYVPQGGISSAVSETIVYDNTPVAGGGIYLTSSVLACGRDRIDLCAKRILPLIDQAVESLRKNWPHLWETL